jgi:hypothetical protein
MDAKVFAPSLAAGEALQSLQSNTAELGPFVL